MVIVTTVIDKVIGLQDMSEERSKNTFLSGAIPLSNQSQEQTGGFMIACNLSVLLRIKYILSYDTGLSSFAGIELDCLKNKARLLQGKLKKSLSAIHSMFSMKKVTLKKLQSLLGLLNFVCSVDVPGRIFLHRLIYHIT